MSTSYEMHELCTVFPLMKGEAFMELVRDIRENGLLEPITLYEGKILDGRNRYTACVNAMVEPRFVEYHGNDPIAFVVSRNMARRHLDASQRAMAAARIANLKHGQRADLQDGPIGTSSIPEAAERLNVGERSVKRARKVIEKGEPELREAVEEGRIAVSLAAKVADMPKEAQVAVATAADPKTEAKKHSKSAKKAAAPKPTASSTPAVVDCVVGEFRRLWMAASEEDRRTIYDIVKRHYASQVAA